MTAVAKNVGKTKITVEVRGCTVCGTEHASGWELARTINVSIGLMRRQVEIRICKECARKKKKK